jgi:competence protein ComEC
MGLGRRQAFWAVTVALLVFVGFVGFSSSVLRAAFMGWFVILARHVGRMARTWRLLLMAAAILNLSNPWLLAFDPGFALSFLATWGLLAWTPIFSRWFERVPEMFGLRETMATTFGATLMTSPYLAWAFGRMSLAGLVTNALALPLVPWAMLWGSVAAVWGDWPGGPFASLPAYGLTHLIILIGQASRLVPWLDWQVPKMEWLMFVASYLWIALWWRTLSEKADAEDGPVDTDVSARGLSDSADSDFGRFNLIPR